MLFQQRVEIPAPIEDVWTFLMDISEVATCVPGVESIVSHGEDRYGGLMRVGIGPIVVRLEGELRVLSRNSADHRAQMRAEATDRRVRGGVTATMTMVLTELNAALTEMQVDTDAVVMGRLGEFGQPIIRRKADQIMEQFAQRLSDRVSRDPGDADADGT